MYASNNLWIDVQLDLWHIIHILQLYFTSEGCAVQYTRNAAVEPPSEYGRIILEAAGGLI